jgi:hypothetical protein
MSETQMLPVSIWPLLDYNYPALDIEWRPVQVASGHNLSYPGLHQLLLTHFP